MQISKTNIEKVAHILFVISLILFPLIIIISPAFAKSDIEFGKKLEQQLRESKINYGEIIKENQRNFEMPLYSDKQQEYIQYAYKISTGDKNFIYMLIAENGQISPDRQSNYVKNGIREPSYGFCQIHKGYHPEIINNPKFFTDWKWQMDKCYSMYKGGVKFYGLSRFKKDWRFASEIKSKITFL